MAIDLITQHIRMKLQQPDLRRVYHNLEVIPSNYQIRGMHTIIRDASTSTPDFVFYADRLLRLVRPRARFRASKDAFVLSRAAQSISNIGLPCFIEQVVTGCSPCAALSRPWGRHV